MLSKNYIYNMANKLIAIIIPLITTPYLTRVLGSDELGLYNYANTIASYYVMFAMMGMSIYGNKQISLARSNNKVSDVFSRLISIQVFNTIICILVYSLYIIFFCNTNKIIAILQLLYIVSAMFDVTWFLQGMEKFKSIAIRNICVNIFTTLLIFIFVKTEDDIIIYTAIKTISVLVSQFSLVVSCRKQFHWEKPKWENIRYIYSQLLVLFLPVVSESVFQNMDRVMLGIIVDYSAVAIYYTSRMITDMPQCVVTSLNTIMYPRITFLFSKGEKEQAKSLTYFTFEIINLLCFAMAFGISAIAADFVKFYLGSDYQYCAVCVSYLAPYIILAAWNGTVRYQYLLPNSMEKIYIKAITIGVVFNLVLNLILINKIGILGAIFATVISEFITAIVQTKAVFKEMYILNHIRNLAIYGITGCFMYIIIKFLLSRYLSCSLLVKVLLEIIVGVVVYVPISFAGIMLFDKKFKNFMLEIFQKRRKIK